MKTNKFNHALRILRQEGILSLLIIVLIGFQKRSRRKGNKNKMEISVIAKYEDVLNADISSPPPAWRGTSNSSLVFNWIMPPPGKGSGGHLNIYRFMKYLEDAGHSNRIYLYTVSEHGPVSGVKASMGNSYPVLKASMEWLDTDTEMESADGIFSTSWETAYASYNSKVDAKRFYFVQDFEPFFYPVGTMSSLAENTYRFGFYGTTAGGWLSSKLKSDYGMEADHFDFGSDDAVYSHYNHEPRKEILYYVRPFTERRGFQVGIMALDLFHKRHPEYTINLVGWDVSEYDIPFPYRNLKTLEIEELNELYNRCAAGLVLSFTNMSLLPLELLKSGTIPVVNDGDNNRMVSDNPFIAYSMSDPQSLAEKLSEVVSRTDQAEHAAQASASVPANSWDASGKKFVSIVEREMRKHG